MQPNQRRCISCRRTAPKAMFLRVVRVHPDRTVQLNEGMGRSAYICPQESCLQLARRKGRLSRALRAQVDESVYRALEAHVAGQVGVGYGRG